MNKLPLLLIALASATTACAQQNATAMKYAGLITADDAKKHLSILASDAFEGRETGKPGAEKAANYIAAEFKKLGLQAPVNGSYFFDVPLTENALKVTAFTVNGRSFEYGADFYFGGAFPDKSTSVNDVVFVGYGTEAEIGSTDLAGKIVLWINEDKPEAGTTPNTSYRMSNARMKVVKNLQSKNPAIILAANPGIAAVLTRLGKSVASPRLTIKDEAAKPANTNAPVINITAALADELVKPTGKSYADLKSASVAAVTPATVIKDNVVINYATTKKDVKAVDVLGYMQGTDLKDEVLVFSAHYDHIGLNPDEKAKDKVNNGADDDGSGTTGVLEIARAFSKAKKDGHGPRRSILFLGNVGEEKGLLGSEYYSDHPVFPLANTITDLNIDMIGRVGEEYIGKPDSANYVYPIGSAMLSKELHEIGENANNTYTKLKLDYKYDDPNDPNRFYYRSDHYNFAKHGVPIIFYFNGVHADYHQPGDEVSKINFPLLAKRAQLVFYTGWELANRDKRPVVDAVAGGGK
ncbi:M28 family peptidase [Mucilaginibacter sp. 3215]|uniref:M28 family peptidase n=1 Tax=Mucilaginibacter sp. 3215 TaxID=3373912 RepID=UPI003D2070C9